MPSRFSPCVYQQLLCILRVRDIFTLSCFYSIFYTNEDGLFLVRNKIVNPFSVCVL